MATEPEDWWARMAAAAPAGFPVALTVGPGLVIPPYESAVDPVAVPALAGAVRLTLALAFVRTISGLVVGAASLVVRFAMPAASSASSCAGSHLPRH